MTRAMAAWPATTGAFTGRRALVTGATRGIGREIACRLAAAGAHTVCLGRDRTALAALRDEIGGEAIDVDLRDIKTLRAIAEAASPIDHLVNNAGVVAIEPFLELSDAAFAETMTVNLHAAIALSQVVARGLIRDQRGGSIVHLSSTASSLGQEGHTVYAASKAALDSLTRSMAVELGPFGIRVNAVNPTVTLTDMAAQAWSDPAQSKRMLARIPLGRFATVADVADSVLFLLGDGASMINGVCLRVDGGHLVT